MATNGGRPMTMREIMEAEEGAGDGHVEYGQTSFASTETALANLEEMLSKVKVGLMKTQPRIKCTLRVDIEGR